MMRAHLYTIAVVCALTGSGHLSAQAQKNDFAPTPPMGWNSWDAYGTTVREHEVKANIDVMSSDLLRFGWQYIIVDIQWSEPNPKSHGYREGAELTMDDFGRLIPAPNRFPSADFGKGFKALADYAHAKGLKFGIHIMRGIPRQAVARNTLVLGTSYHAREVADTTSTCKWNSDMYGVDVSKAGGQAYYDSLVVLYSSWGIDFIKADDMSRPYHNDEITALHRAIQKSGRQIVLSLSPGPAPTSEIVSLRDNAQMWRMADDLWDNWKSVREMYTLAETWAPLVVDGHWPDADMLPLGHIGLRAERGDDRLSSLTHDEQQMVMTLWSIFRSPLMFGGDLPTLDPYTRKLITNPEVLALDQHSTGNKPVFSDKSLRIWTAKAENGEMYVAVFNLGEKPLLREVAWPAIHIASPIRVRDLWNKTDVPNLTKLSFIIPAHGAQLYSVTDSR